MALQLALGCQIVGYANVHRRCCRINEPCFNCPAPESLSIANSSAIGGSCPFPDIDGTYDVSLFDHPGGDSWGAVDGSNACDWNLYILNSADCGAKYITTAFRLVRPGLVGTNGFILGQIHYSYNTNNTQALFNYRLPLLASGYTCPRGSIQIPFLSGSGFYNLVGGGTPPVVDQPDLYLNFP